MNLEFHIYELHKYIKNLEVTKAELLAALKVARSAFEADENFYSNVTKQIDEAIANAK